MYCNKCGVKLARYLTKCPLCQGNVSSDVDNDGMNSYSTDIEYLAKEINVIYFAKLIMTIIILSTMITVICNLAINKTVSWSLYVVFSCIFVCFHYFYLVSSKRRLCFIINVVNLELLLFVSAYLNNGLWWYLCLVGPFILIGGFSLIFLGILSKFKNIFRNIAYFLIYTSVSLFLINGLVKVYKTGVFHLSWSYYANVPLILISILLITLSFNKKLMLEVDKRLFI